MNYSIKTILCSLLLLLSLTAFCQSTSGAEGIINEIKKSGNYLYAEATSPEWREASDNATYLLRITIEDWLSNIGYETDVNDIINEKKVIRARRYELFRAFIYVKKPVVPENEGMTLETGQNRTFGHTIGDTDKIEKQLSISSNSLTQEEQAMLEVQLFSQIEPYISELQGKNVIRDYGKYKTLPDNKCYIFVYNRKGDIVAAIRKDGENQVNIKTGEKDDVDRYKGCGAIWFRMQ